MARIIMLRDEYIVGGNAPLYRVLDQLYTNCYTRNVGTLPDFCKSAWYSCGWITVTTVH